MLKRTNGGIGLHLFNLLLFLLYACGSPSSSANSIPSTAGQDTVKQPFIKPPAVFEDTLTVNQAAIVFFYPDSLQLQQIKQQLDTAAFAGLEHESFYQMRYSRLTVETKWPQIRVQNAINCRYLQFIKENGSPVVIDLNKVPLVYGAYLFNRKKDPVLPDMTNIETEIAYYME